MENKKKILLVYANFSTFVKQDYEILSEKYLVKEYHFVHTKNATGLVVQFFRQFFHLLFSGWQYHAFFIWFSDYHAVLPVLFAKIARKKSLIVVGGYDAFSYPSINYGVFLKKNLRSFCARSAYSHVNYILPVTKSLIRSTNRQIAPPNEIDGGITFFVKNIGDKITVLHTSFNSDTWDFSTTEKKENTIITVALINDERTYYVKGIDLYVETAKLLPSITFTIVGMNLQLFRFLNKEVPENVICLGLVSPFELQQKVKESMVYAQFSRTEGLPSVVCEAMLAGCIPVGTNVGGIPELINHIGFVFDGRDAETAKKAILEAFTLSKDHPSSRNKARQFIIEKCNKDYRLSELQRLINS